MIRIVLADDHSMVRMGFKMLIMQQKDFEVVGEASDPNEAFELVKQLSPETLVASHMRRMEDHIPRFDRTVFMRRLLRVRR